MTKKFFLHFVKMTIYGGKKEKVCYREESSRLNLRRVFVGPFDISF